MATSFLQASRRRWRTLTPPRPLRRPPATSSLPTAAAAAAAMLPLPPLLLVDGYTDAAVAIRFLLGFQLLCLQCQLQEQHAAIA
jgi:hypothetical protein